MKRLIKILFLTLIIGVSSCATKKRTIKIDSLVENSIKIGVDNGTALIKFNRNDLIDQFDKDLKEWFDPRLKRYVDNLASLKSDTIFIKNKSISSLPLAEYELKFHTLILKGKAEIILKENNKKLENIKYEFTRSKLGQEDANFYAKDGTEFYHILIAFGE